MFNMLFDHAEEDEVETEEVVFDETALDNLEQNA